MPAPDIPSRPAPRKPIFLFLFLAALLASLAFLALVPNPLTDSIVSRACSTLAGRPVVLRGVSYEFHQKPYLVFNAREIDLRSLLEGQDSPAGRYVQKHGLSAWLVVKDSRWVLRRADGALYLRLLKASAGESSLQGGLRLDAGRVSRWSAALRLPETLWGHFPDLVEKRFARDASGRRIFKLTWNRGRWRLWGRMGPVLEAKWQ